MHLSTFDQISFLYIYSNNHNVSVQIHTITMFSVALINLQPSLINPHITAGLDSNSLIVFIKQCYRAQAIEDFTLIPGALNGVAI